MLRCYRQRPVLDLDDGFVNVGLDICYRTGDEFIPQVLTRFDRHDRNRCLGTCPFQRSAAGGAGAGNTGNDGGGGAGLKKDFRAAATEAQGNILQLP